MLKFAFGQILITDYFSNGAIGVGGDSSLQKKTIGAFALDRPERPSDPNALLGTVSLTAQKVSFETSSWNRL